MQVPGPVMRVEDVSDARVRVYLPSAEGPLPAVVFCHGGGFLSGSLDSVDPTCRRLAAENGVVVVSVDYRLAPEHPFPAATQDTFAALRWTHEHIAEYGGDPARIAVMGESAGGNLVALAAIRARDEGIPLAAQVLIYPTTDPESPGASHAEFAHGPVVHDLRHELCPVAEMPYSVAVPEPRRSARALIDSASAPSSSTIRSAMATIRSGGTGGRPAARRTN